MNATHTRVLRTWKGELGNVNRDLTDSGLGSVIQPEGTTAEVLGSETANNGESPFLSSSPLYLEKC